MIERTAQPMVVSRCWTRLYPCAWWCSSFTCTNESLPFLFQPLRQRSGIWQRKIPRRLHRLHRWTTGHWPIRLRPWRTISICHCRAISAENRRLDRSRRVLAWKRRLKVAKKGERHRHVLTHIRSSNGNDDSTRAKLRAVFCNMNWCPPGRSTMWISLSTTQVDRPKLSTKRILVRCSVRFSRVRVVLIRSATSVTGIVSKTDILLIRRWKRPNKKYRSVADWRQITTLLEQVHHRSNRSIARRNAFLPLNQHLNRWIESSTCSLLQINDEKHMTFGRKSSISDRLVLVSLLSTLAEVTRIRPIRTPCPFFGTNKLQFVRMPPWVIRLRVLARNPIRINVPPPTKPLIDRLVVCWKIVFDGELWFSSSNNHLNETIHRIPSTRRRIRNNSYLRRANLLFLLLRPVRRSQYGSCRSVMVDSLVHRKLGKHQMNSLRRQMFGQPVLHWKTKHRLERKCPIIRHAFHRQSIVVELVNSENRIVNVHLVSNNRKPISHNRKITLARASFSIYSNLIVSFLCLLNTSNEWYTYKYKCRCMYVRVRMRLVK